MSRRLLVATNNAGKLREFRRLFEHSLELTVVSPGDLGLTLDVVEDGDTFAANAEKKARAFARVTSLMVLADDSGLEVDHLAGAPGVHSARYAEGRGDAANNEKLLRNLEGIAGEARTARFRCVLAFVDEGGSLGSGVHLEDGVCEGQIGFEGRGDGGFGYDPLFVPLGEDRTMAELRPEEKDARSHRAAATRKMHRFLRGYLG